MADSSAKPMLSMQQRAGALAADAMSRFRGLEPRQRGRMLTAAALVAACLAGILWYSARTDWRTLYAGLDTEDARQMAQELTTAGIPFDVSPDGSSLRVPVQNLDKARLATTAKGGPRSGRMGFEIFDKPNWMGSEFDEQVNYQRALEGELEHTIGTLAAVQTARVHLVLPHDSLFSSEQRDAKASVVLRLRHRLISDEEAEAIANLVASAVDDLRPENVVLVDADGHGILGARRGDAALAAHEQQMAEKLVETLEPIAGVGNVRASVNVDYDSSSADEVDETYDPAGTVTLSMQRTEQNSGQPQASGIPGTASNAASATPPLYPPQNGHLDNLKQESGTYGVSKKVRHTVQQPGRVRRVTAAVLINYRRTARGKQTGWEPRSADEMKRLTDLAESVVGLDRARGDQISVEELPFDDNAPVPEPPLRDRLLGMAGRSQDLLRYGTILVILLAFLLWIARPVVHSLTSGLSARTPLLPAGEGQRASAEAGPLELSAEPAAVDENRRRAQGVFDRVAEQVKQDPAQSARLIESWIRSE